MAKGQQRKNKEAKKPKKKPAPAIQLGCILSGMSRPEQNSWPGAEV